MLTHPTRKGVLRHCSLLTAALVFPVLVSAQTAATAPRQQPEDSVITLAPQSSEHSLRAHAMTAKRESAFANAPRNFRVFADATVGKDSEVEPLTLNFSDATTLTKIESKTQEFAVEPGGTCAEGKSYSAGQSCTLLVRFTPSGAGNRLGKLSIGHSAKPQAVDIGLGGNGYAPVLVFTPGLITTVPGTYPSSAGLLSGASSLTVDGNDTLYIADTGNNLVRYIDSSGTVRTLASGYTAPLGITTDTFGEVYFDLTGSNLMYEVYDYGPVVQITGSGTDACTAAAPCSLNSEALHSPGRLSTDGYNRLFFPDNTKGAAMVTAQPSSPKLIYLYDPFPYQTTPTASVGADSSDNLYTLWSNGGTCSIIRQSLYDAENSNVGFTKIAGGHACGFAGDGGQAGNAEISAKIGDIVFDLAGNLYFSDTNNQRVRRIDRITGQINTIAGNGTAGYSGDGNGGVFAALSYPTGVAVDSTGAVYIISGTGTTTGGAQIIRKVGPNGYRQLPDTFKGSQNTRVVTLSNVGNNGFTLTNLAVTGANASEFTIDPATTSCLVTPGSYISAGQTCNIGITFAPTAKGARQADIVLLGNTVSGSTSIHVYGNGTVPQPNITINSPSNGAVITSGSTVTFKATVSSTTSPAPTGTITFYWAGVSQGTIALSSGSAQVTVTPGTTGSRVLQATYNGDANYAPISLSETVTVVAPSNQPVHIIQAPVQKPIRKSVAPDSK